jgi:hypothetical protein
MNYPLFSFLLITCSFSSPNLCSQINLEPYTFSGVYVNDFANVKNSAIAFADVDNDGDQDVLIAGSNYEMNSYFTHLYLNIGKGNYFLDTRSTFIPVVNGEIAFSDIDNDGDLDVLICGHDGKVRRTDIYLNNGKGVFSEKSNSKLIGVSSCGIEFSDVDMDGDDDLILTGHIDASSEGVSELYLNDGSGNFDLKPNQISESYSGSDVAFSDVDKDGDEDMVIVGASYPDNGSPGSALYKNDGFGNFSSPIYLRNGGYGGTATFGDIDNDGDDDLLISGARTILYVNDGTGIFSEVQNIPFRHVERGSIAFADIDNDTDLDVVISGDGSLSNPEELPTELFTNDGSGTFTLVENTPFPSVGNGSVGFADVDNDGDIDYLSTGGTHYSILDDNDSTSLFINDGSGNFSSVEKSKLTEIYNGEVGVFDADNDGDKDLFLTGNIHYKLGASELFLNNGSAKFSPIVNSPFINGMYSSLGLADVDNDNDIDILIASATYDTIGYSRSLLYINDIGTKSFSLKNESSIKSMRNGALIFNDFDQDGNTDLYITGDGMNSENSETYMNDGVGNFNLKSNDSLLITFGGSSASFDVDGDGDPDLLQTGSRNDIDFSELFINDGKGNFVLSKDTPFTGVSKSAVSYADVENDGDFDVLITGNNWMLGDIEITELYLNDGEGNFSLDNQTTFPGLKHAAAVFSDIDKDGFPDLVLSGETSESRYFTRVYRNDTYGKFTSVPDCPIIDLFKSSIAFGDLDNDGDEEMVICGKTKIAGIKTRIYKNLSQTCTVQTELPSVKICWGDSTFVTGKYRTRLGRYLERYKTINGCDSLVFTRIELRPDVKARYDQNPSIICLANGEITLSEATPTGGNYAGIGVSNNTFNPVLSGTGEFIVEYSVKDDKSGCMLSDVSRITVANCAGIDEYSSENIRIYPVPVDDLLHVQVTAVFELIILDNQGRIVKSLSLKSGENQIYTQDLNPGIYHLKFHNANQTFGKKFTLVR